MSNDNTYQTPDDLLEGAIDAAERQAWEFEEIGDLLAADKADIEYYCNQVDYEKEKREMEERDAERRKSPEQKAADAVKKKERQDNYDYVYKGITREGFAPTDRHKSIRERHLANMERLKDTPFPFE
jgi:phage terminase small subunit